MLGIYLSGHPLEKLRDSIEKQTDINTMQMRQVKEEVDTTGSTTKYKDGQYIKFAGIVSSVKKKYTKNNKLMAFVTLEDLYGTAEIIVFESVYHSAASILVNDNVVLVDGRLSIREDEDVKIVAREITDFNKVEKDHNTGVGADDPVSQMETQRKTLKINITNFNETQKAKLRGALKYFNGERNNTPVQVINGEQALDCGAIYMTEEILKEFQELFGEDLVKLE